MKSISVIVPVYKVEVYLRRCLDSLCRQSMKDIEIILIDDASPDRCGEICEEYAAKDMRFQVIHHLENQGLSASRNTGIQLATGNFLMFVDSDDWVHEDFCKIPYECALQYQAELVMFRFKRVDLNKTLTNSSTNKNSPKVLFNNGYMIKSEALELLQCNSYDVGNVVWNKLYHKKLFTDVRYPEGYLFEDVGTTYKTILKASSIYFLDKHLYYYCLRKDSITNCRTKKALKDLFNMQMRQYHDLLTWGGYSAEKLNFYLQSNSLKYCIKQKRDISDSSYVFCEKTLKYCKIAGGFTQRQRVMLFLLKYFPGLFELVCKLWGRKYSDC